MKSPPVNTGRHHQIKLKHYQLKKSYYLTLTGHTDAVRLGTLSGFFFFRSNAEQEEKNHNAKKQQCETAGYGFDYRNQKENKHSDQDDAIFEHFFEGFF